MAGGEARLSAAQIHGPRHLHPRAVVLSGEISSHPPPRPHRVLGNPAPPATDASAVLPAGLVACAEVVQAIGSHSRAVPGEPLPHGYGCAAVVGCGGRAAPHSSCLVLPLAQIRHRVCRSASTVRADCKPAPARAAAAAGARAASAPLPKLPGSHRQPAQLGHDASSGRAAQHNGAVHGVCQFSGHVTRRPRKPARVPCLLQPTGPFATGMVARPLSCRPEGHSVLWLWPAAPLRRIARCHHAHDPQAASIRVVVAVPPFPWDLPRVCPRGRHA